MQLHPFRREVGHLTDPSSLGLDEFHDRSHVFGRGDDHRLYPRLRDRLELRRFGKILRAADRLHGPVGEGNPVFHRRCGRHEVEVVLTFEPLTHDLHVQQAQEPTPESEAERARGFGLVGQR